MKKLLLILCVTLLFCSCSNQKPTEKTVIGMFTPYTYFPETVNKKVKAVKETNYLPSEKAGKIETGEHLTAAMRDSINWTGDFMVQFDKSGLAEKVSNLDESGKVTGVWDIMSDSVFYTNAKRSVNDSLTVLEKIKKEKDGSYLFEIFNPIADTLWSKAVIKFADNTRYEYIQWHNYKGEPTNKFLYTYDPNGNLISYTVSRKDTVRGGMNFTCNEHGFIKTQETYNKIRETSDMYNYEYEYDDAGNWVKNVAYKNEKPVVVTLREYTYY